MNRILLFSFIITQFTSFSLSGDSGQLVFFDLDGWHSVTKQDANSKEILNETNHKNDDIQLKSNTLESRLDRMIMLSAGMITLLIVIIVHMLYSRRRFFLQLRKTRTVDN